ncbi:MAG: carboxypeptidase M32 [Thermoplasmata archaeon]
MFENKKILDLIKKYKIIWSLESTESLLNWDLETFMPMESYQERGLVLNNISKIKRNIYYEMKSMMSSAEKEKDLNEAEIAFLRELKREIIFSESMSSDFYKKFSILITKSTIKWREAKIKSDYKIFEPILKDVLDLTIKKTEYLDNNKNPYDILLDIYSEGLTMNDVDNIFLPLSKELPKIRENIIDGGYFVTNHPLENIKYDQKLMEDVNLEIVKLLDIPFSKFRFTISTHPFTVKIGPNDIRITTRYEGINFKNTMYSTIHECGHAIYSMQQNPELEFTPLAHRDSIDASTELGGFSESQSRFWENIIGKSYKFISDIYPILLSKLSFINNYTEDDIYRYVNIIKPTPIRVDSDEVNYNLHIIIRYEIEKELILGKLNTNELPNRWNELMEKYIGIQPKTDSEGVLQDIHWSKGMFGYFPTYALGNVISAMIWSKLKKDLFNMSYPDIKRWLYENIHKYGKIYIPKDLALLVFKEPINHEKFIEYLSNKYIK